MRTVLHLMETSGPGGAETVALELMRGMDRSRWRSVAVLYDSGWLSHQLAEHGIPSVIIEERGSFDIGYLRRLLAVVREHGVDLIHAHLFGATVRAGLLSRLTGVPAIGTLHGAIDLAPDERYRTIKRWLVHGVHRLTFVSEPLRRVFFQRASFAEGMCVVIPNGIDASRFVVPRDDRLLRDLDVPPRTFVVGAVGNLNEAKGFDVLLRAAAILRARSSGWHFVIVGDDKFRQARELLDLRDRLGLREHVTYAGFRSDVPNLLATFDAYALTSRSEGFSLATVEAMASGLPVVATRCGGPEQIIEDRRTGVLVENGSPEAVANALEELRADPDLRAALGSAAREAARVRFTIESSIRCYEQLYDECLAARGRAASRAPVAKSAGGSSGAGR